MKEGEETERNGRGEGGRSGRKWERQRGEAKRNRRDGEGRSG